MERYNYREALADDIREYISERNISPRDYEDADAMYQDLNDKLWGADIVTGNGSGSYYCNAWMAEEAICHNLDLIADAMKEFGGEYPRDAETADVIIRCYLLGEMLGEVIDQDYAEEDFGEEETEDEEDSED